MELVDVSARIGWPVVAGFGLAVVVVLTFAVLGLVRPDLIWRMRRSVIGWQYRRGDQIELSPAGRAWERFRALVVLVVTLVVAVLVGSRAINWSAEDRVQRDFDGPATVYDLADAAAAPGCAVRIVACLRSDDVFPIEVVSHQGSGADLELRVGYAFFPTHAVVDEAAGRVTVSVYGRCAPPLRGEPYGDSASDCESDPRTGFVTYGLVPVALDEPLGRRALVDGHTRQPIEPS